MRILCLIELNTSNLVHFKGVEIPVLQERNNVDLIIELSEKALLTVLEDRESLDPNQPNYVLSRLGPMASGGRI